MPKETRITPEQYSAEERHPGESVSLSINLEKGLLIETEKHDFALVLGRRFRSKYDRKETLGLQFGLFPNSRESRRFESLSTVEKIKSLTYRYPGSYGTGDFYEDSITGNIRTDCWADGFTFGGQRINTWDKKKLLTLTGMDACLEIIQRTTKNAFI